MSALSLKIELALRDVERAARRRNEPGGQDVAEALIRGAGQDLAVAIEEEVEAAVKQHVLEGALRVPRTPVTQPEEA